MCAPWVRCAIFRGIAAGSNFDVVDSVRTIHNPELALQGSEGSGPSHLHLTTNAQSTEDAGPITNPEPEASTPKP